MARYTKRARAASPRAENKRAKATATDKVTSSSASSTRPEFTNECVVAAARRSLEELLATTSVSIDSILHGARTFYLTDDNASWVYHAPGWYKRLYEALRPHALAYDAWVDAVWALHPPHQDAIKLFGKDVLMPRFQQVYGQDYRFSGKLFEAEPFPTLLHHALHAMQRLVVHPETRETYARGGLVNWYANGEHYMGPHADNESTIHAQSPVLSLSLGATRRFVFTPKSGSTSSERVEMLLGDGDLLVMGGTTQMTHKHALPKMKNCTDKRVSVTLRCFT